MTDKEVGDLWQWCRLPGTQGGKVEGLIRKLVAERANSKCESMPSCYMRCAHEKEALRDFHIPEDSWQEKS